MNIKFEQYSTDQPAHGLAVAFLGVWASESDSMGALSRKKFEDFPYSVLAFMDDSLVSPLGHIAVTEYRCGEATIGGYIVNPKFRGRGIGSQLLQHVIDTLPTVIPATQKTKAHANQASLGQFIKAGGSVIGHTQIPPSTGCDTIVDMTPALKGIEL